MKSSHFWRVVPAILSMVAVTEPSIAGPIQAISYPLPPLVEERDGRAIGPAIEVLRELAKAAGVDQRVEVAPLPRVLQEIADGDRIAVAMTRTAERESKYTWICTLYPDFFAFATIQPNPKLDTVERAISAGTIGTLGGGSQVSMLQNFGVKDIASVSNQQLNAAKLEAGRIQSWFSPATVMKHVWRQEGRDPAKLQIGNSIAELTFWALASKNIPPEVIEKMQKRCAEMKQNGEYDKIFSELNR